MCSLKYNLKCSFPSCWHVCSHFKQQRLKIWPSIDLAAPFKTDWAKPLWRAARPRTDQLAQQLSPWGECCNRQRFPKLCSRYLIWLCGDGNAFPGLTGNYRDWERSGWLGGTGWHRLLPGDGPLATSQHGPTGTAHGKNVFPRLSPSLLPLLFGTFVLLFSAPATLLGHLKCMIDLSHSHKCSVIYKCMII